MAQTVAECLTAGEDSATLITDVNTNGANSTRILPDLTQAQINEVVQHNVDHLETILAYDGTDDTPNVVGSSSSKKTTCSNAITTGKAYIAANS
tara:strand:- start:94 stop:375 length:282 start_codon:yes stop_codon:yes gene_type:complete